MEVRDPDGKLVSIVDSRQVIRERPPASEARSEPQASGVEKAGASRTWPTGVEGGAK
jgi:hypothetical protein